MGQAAKSEIAIFLNNPEVDIPLDLTSATALQQAMLEHYYKTNPDAVGKPDITIVDFEMFEGEIDLTLYSTRRQNLEFQVDLLNDYLDMTHFDIIDEVTEDTWVQS